MRLAGGALGQSAAVREGELLTVTGGAGRGAVDRKALVVEEVSAELDERLVWRRSGRGQRSGERSGSEQSGGKKEELSHGARNESARHSRGRRGQ